MKHVSAKGYRTLSPASTFPLAMVYACDPHHSHFRPCFFPFFFSYAQRRHHVRTTPPPPCRRWSCQEEEEKKEKKRKKQVREVCVVQRRGKHNRHIYSYASTVALRCWTCPKSRPWQRRSEKVHSLISQHSIHWCAQMTRGSPISMRTY